MVELRTFGGLSIEANSAPPTGAAAQRLALCSRARRGSAVGLDRQPAERPQLNHADPFDAGLTTVSRRRPNMALGNGPGKPDPRSWPRRETNQVSSYD